MRLFHQLSEEEREKAVDYCVDVIVGDIISGELMFGQQDGEDLPDAIAQENKVFSKMLKAIDKFETDQEKADCIFEDKEMMDIIFGLAFEMQKSFHYLDYNDRVMFPDDYSPDHVCEHCQAEQEANALPELPSEEKPAKIPASKHAPKHKKHSIN